MARLISLLGNSQKLDGGAMFGHVPKALWSKWITPDDENKIPLACRALLIQDEHKNVLLETGIGAFFNPTMRDRYGVVEQEHVLLNSLKSAGLSENDIDFIILSHLHFDHAGGLLSTWEPNQELKLLFPNARYIVSKTGWERATHPHVRDKASFIPELNQLLAQSERLMIIDNEKCQMLGDDYHFLLTNGHTPGLLHTHFKSNDHSVIFASDLIPGLPWIHLPVCMGYDRAPELLIDEKKQMLDYAIKEKAYLFYTHDVHVALSAVTKVQDKYVAHKEVNIVDSTSSLTMNL